MEERPWYKNYDAGITRKLKYPQIPVFNLLDNTAMKYPEKAALIFMGKRITYSVLLSYANSFALALSKLGVKKGDRVSLYLPNTPHMVIAYYGALKAGAIAVNTNPLYMERELEYQINDSEAETIVTLNSKFLLSKVKSIKDKTCIRNVIIGAINDFLPFPKNILYTIKERNELEQLPSDLGYYKFVDLLQNPPDDLSEVVVGSEDTAVIQYTGGTTGISKGVILTHQNLVSNLIQIRMWSHKALEEGKEVILTVLPLYHNYGMNVCMNFGFSIGATLILLPRFELLEVLETIKKYKPTAFPAIPTIYQEILDYPQSRTYGINSIKHYFSAASPLPIEVLKNFEKTFGVRIIEGFGLSETSPVTHSNPLGGKRKVGSVGLPFPDTDAKIVDLESGEKELPFGETGELIIKGPQVMRGYLNCPDETNRTLRNGWLFTGDIAKMDEEGYFYIVDRKKDLIIVGGFYNVYPREVEEILYQHPKILEAAVIGIPDKYEGEIIKAFIVLNNKEEKVTEEEIINFAKERLADYKVPKLVEFRDSLPKSLIGKVLRRVIRDEELKKPRV